MYVFDILFNSTADYIISHLSIKSIPAIFFLLRRGKIPPLGTSLHSGPVAHKGMPHAAP